MGRSTGFPQAKFGPAAVVPGVVRTLKQMLGANPAAEVGISNLVPFLSHRTVRTCGGTGMNERWLRRKESPAAIRSGTFLTQCDEASGFHVSGGGDSEHEKMLTRGILLGEPWRMVLTMMRKIQGEKSTPKLEVFEISNHAMENPSCKKKLKE